MSNTKEKLETVAIILQLAQEWINYVDSCGNECAYTDCIIESIQSKASKL